MPQNMQYLNHTISHTQVISLHPHMTALDASSCSSFSFLIHGSTAKTTFLFAYFGNCYIRLMASGLDLFVGNVCLTPYIEELLPAMIRGYNGILWGNINERISLNLIISKY